MFPSVPPKGLTGLLFVQIDLDNFPPRPKKTFPTSSSFIFVIVVSIRIPMDVSQLDKSDSESESD